MGWRGRRDQDLLRLAEAQFQILVTIDAGFQHEQNLVNFVVGVLLVRVPNNKLESYRPLFTRLSEAAEGVRAGQLVVVECP